MKNSKQLIDDWPLGMYTIEKVHKIDTLYKGEKQHGRI
jgi:hypothetical protein